MAASGVSACGIKDWISGSGKAPIRSANTCGQVVVSMCSLVGRSSVMNMYMCVFETGLTPILMCSSSHMRGRMTVSGRGITARQTPWPMYSGGLTSGKKAARSAECTPSAPITRS
ncbi:hypothetical protein D9M69_689020 [compost metagenome]